MSENNKLEQAFKQAISDNSAREAFYEVLMSSSVYVVGREEAQPNGQPAHVQLKQWEQPDGTMALPFFPTAQSLGQLLGEGEMHICLPVVELFKSVSDAILVLTTSDGSKAFKPDEIAALLSSVMALDPLAKSLAEAIKNNTDEARHEFYTILINSQVFVLGRPQDESAKPGEGPRAIKPDDQFLINACPHPFIKDQKALPFFSSLEHLKRAAPPNSQYMGFSALHILSMSLEMGLPLILNPGFQVNKLFAKEEVEFLLKSTVEEPFEQRYYAPGSKVYLSSPEKYPQEMVGALLDFLPKYPEIKAAYLAVMKEESEEAQPVLVIGFEAESGDLSEMFRAAGPLVGEYAEEGMPIDFAKIQAGERGLSQYFLEKADPFYRRALHRGEKNTGSAPTAPTQSSSEQYDQAGFFGRLKRIFGGSK